MAYRAESKDWQNRKPGHPEQNGRHERMHLTLKKETTRPCAANILAQQERFDKFKSEFNFIRPHEAINMSTPSEVFISPEKNIMKQFLMKTITNALILLRKSVTMEWLELEELEKNIPCRVSLQNNM
ncbi:MAG: transposase [Deltaproteobacteria bacterium]|nr:transposase [Deltaproteobacteria bacterium]